MTDIRTILQAVRVDRGGASATEYAMAAGILALGIAPAFTGLMNRLGVAMGALSF